MLGVCVDITVFMALGMALSEGWWEVQGERDDACGMRRNCVVEIIKRDESGLGSRSSCI